MYNEYDMDMALTEYMDIIKADWSRWRQISGLSENNLNVFIKPGSKFFKICVEGSGVHSFICRKAHGIWQIGDVLKAATYNAPAKNFKRGNILKQEYSGRVSWSGL